MNLLKKWLDRLTTKKSILLIGLLGVVVVGVSTTTLSLFFVNGGGACENYYVGWCLTLWDALSKIDNLNTLVWLLPPLLIAGFLRNEVFKPWARFALVWMLVMIITPNFVPDMSRMFAPSNRGLWELLLLGIYVVGSVLIIFVQSIRVYWLKK